MIGSDARLRAVLGDEPPLDATAVDWADGYGIVSPDVARYTEVLRSEPGALDLAMRNVARQGGLELLDADTATLLGLYVRAQRPEHVLELGTGLGLITMHLARNAPPDCTVTSIDEDPGPQGQAHAFLERGDHECAVELRLGDPQRVLRSRELHRVWDVVVLSDPHADRLAQLDEITPHMGPDALLVIPWALRGGRVADGAAAWSGDRPRIEHQRALNRSVASDPRFTDVVLLPVGDGLLLARHCR